MNLKRNILSYSKKTLFVLLTLICILIWPQTASAEYFSGSLMPCKIPVGTSYDYHSDIFWGYPDEVIYSVDDESIATVDENGVIYGVSEGETRLRVRIYNEEYSSLPDGGYMDSTRIYVYDPENTVLHLGENKLYSSPYTFTPEEDGYYFFGGPCDELRVSEEGTVLYSPRCYDSESPDKPNIYLRGGVTYEVSAQDWKTEGEPMEVTIHHTEPGILSISNAAKGIKIQLDKNCENEYGETVYCLYRKSSGESWKRIAYFTDSDTDTYLDENVTSGVSYTYTVRMLDQVKGKVFLSEYDHKGKTSKFLSSITPGVSNASKGVKITWTKVEGAEGYIVYRKKGSEEYGRLGLTDETSWIDADAVNGTTYTYAVRAYKGNTKGWYTGKKMVRLTSPSISSLSNAATRKMTVKWKTNSKATGYQVQYAKNSKFDSPTTKSYKGATVRSKTYTSLTKGKTYYVRVRSYKTVGDAKYYSGWSGTKSVKISK